MIDWQTVVAIISAVFAGFSGLIAFQAKKEAKSASVGTAMTSRIERYQTIVKLKDSAREEGNADKIKQSFAELFGLYWGETYLWIDGMIADYIMLHWVNTWALAFYHNEKIIIKDEEISYCQQWDEAKSTVFRSDEPFKAFLDKVNEYENKEIKP